MNGPTAPIVQTVILDRLVVHRSEMIEALRGYYGRSPPRRVEWEDAYEIRHMIEGWGQNVRVELRCPTTWWDHAKLALRERWPRMFGRMVVRFTTAVAENGAIVAGLQAKLAGRHLVIPYKLPTTWTGWIDQGKPISWSDEE
jgi:hypothetical protein